MSFLSEKKEYAIYQNNKIFSQKKKKKKRHPHTLGRDYWLV